MKKREEFSQWLFETLIKHDFTIKVFFIGALNILLPLIWPLIGVSMLMLIDLYTSYQSSRRDGIRFHSKGIGLSIRKWLEFLIGVIVTTIIDLLCVRFLNVSFHFFTSIFIMLAALRELKSISENFAGLGLASAMRVFLKFLGTKNTKLYEAIDKELESKKKKIIEKQEYFDKLKKDDGNKTDLR